MAEDGTGRLAWIGHSTVLVELDGARVLTDPVLRRRVAHLRRAEAAVEPGTLGPVDLILISHVHWDHLDVPSLVGLGRDTRVVVPRGAGTLLERRGFTHVVEIGEGGRADVNGLAVRATHAAHSAARGPLGVKAPALGYLLGDRRRVYFAGDTDLFAGMAGLADHLHVALLPIAGWGPRLPAGHLDPERAATALRMLRPRLAVPIHWGTYRPLCGRGPREAPGDEFARRAAQLVPDVEVHVLPLGADLRF
jgi:L-ascorbate metabolism protein UlaG (beta-lactamase superfamily)